MPASPKKSRKWAWAGNAVARGAVAKNRDLGPKERVLKRKPQQIVRTAYENSVGSSSQALG
jgi:hypothetical protein